MCTLHALAKCAAQLLGFDNFIPPFAGTSGDQILNGANFASAAAGIRAETGQQLVGVRVKTAYHC
jgi:hypothetical protein